MADAPQLNIPPGLLAVTTHGLVTAETTKALLDMRAHAQQIGLTNLQWQLVINTLVDKARNEAVRAMLATPGCAFLWFLDADMQWEPALLDIMLVTAFRDCPWADIVGGYCQLRAEPFLPTIDTGTGTWEPHDAGQGPLEVIRTGAACVLVKRHVFEAMEPPWYGVRNTPRALNIVQEFDGFCRQKFDGRNPFSQSPSWKQILDAARDTALSERLRQPPQAPESIFTSSVGEDSAFCDRAKSLDFRIVVQTNAIVRHLDRRLIGPELHMEQMKNYERMAAAAVGVLAP